MKNKQFFSIIMFILSIVILASFLIPTIKVTWVLPGEDIYGNPIWVTEGHYYNIWMLIDVFEGDGLILLPLLYIDIVIAYGILSIMKIFGIKIKTRTLVILLIYPFLVGIISFYQFSIYNIFVLACIIFSICILILNLIDGLGLSKRQKNLNP